MLRLRRPRRGGCSTSKRRSSSSSAAKMARVASAQPLPRRPPIIAARALRISGEGRAMPTRRRIRNTPSIRHPGQPTKTSPGRLTACFLENERPRKPIPTMRPSPAKSDDRAIPIRVSTGTPRVDQGIPNLLRPSRHTTNTRRLEPVPTLPMRDSIDAACLRSSLPSPRMASVPRKKEYRLRSSRPTTTPMSRLRAGAHTPEAPS